MTLYFSKMHGLGNDFMVINALNQTLDLSAEKIKSWANRYRGIGFDQLLIIEKSASADFDFNYRIFNADGGEVEHCGNGARCFAKYLHDFGLHDFARPVRVKIKKGGISIAYQGLNAENEALYAVDMGVPLLDTPVEIEKRLFYRANMGNPHAVTVVENVETAPVETVGKALQNLPELFPERVNVGFMEIIHRGKIKLRVFERGVGETQACGTGACGAVASGISAGLLDTSVEVILLGGTLKIDWVQGEPLYMSGSASHVYRGELVQ